MLLVDVEKSTDVVVVRCSGRIVRGTEVRTLRNAVASQQTTRLVVLDLTGVEAIDAGGLNVLVALHHWTQDRGIRLKLVNPSHFVREMLERTHLHVVFEISSFEEALHVLGECGKSFSSHAA
jgi:anti-anti-sigma factor